MLSDIILSADQRGRVAYYGDRGFSVIDRTYSVGVGGRKAARSAPLSTREGIQAFSDKQTTASYHQRPNRQR